jgi:radical SAM protein with 4Fe4S-binding SPASM domain
MNKDFLLNESKTFCMFPWLHLNATPKGDVYPCCSNDYTQPVGNTKDNSLEEIFNSPKMKELRVDMLNEKKNSICDFCYKHEEAGPYSFRNYSKEQFANRFDDATSDDVDVWIRFLRYNYYSKKRLKKGFDSKVLKETIANAITPKCLWISINTSVITKMLLYGKEPLTEMILKRY